MIELKQNGIILYAGLPRTSQERSPSMPCQKGHLPRDDTIQLLIVKVNTIIKQASSTKSFVNHSSLSRYN
ncbi:hypothetical protein BCIN_05g06260 [Botrytis cinerea B05.10]|uniref:Uncharacterized protein n=2 Tax=Botryotinia fuckeliana TaxID=40559 RepID=A0A384JI41_BOTFB|nr:hypothetical protein BCIN_05g06260 [Botrytis cinerea B05.10]ATZ50258.1 hypothetical protein BCIN_05g06260 [Botrytis cinerea B05.10]CCD53457.1 hypothetical protein BofuT4_uP135020.1 [Botrytis cinerea T4]